MTPPLAVLGLDATQRVWEAQAKADPLWAVLSDPDKRGRRWSVDDFLASGEAQIASSMHRFEGLGGILPDRESVLDFGCGVGRLTQPLARRFDRVVGVDISPTMVEVARRLNKYGSRVEYILNERPDLAFIPDHSVSLVYTHITLQHIPPDATKRYLDEFFRIVKPSGAVIFQLPSHLSESYLPSEQEGAPVPPAARRALISADVPATLPAGLVTPLRVNVHNASDRDWVQTAEQPLNVGNHWLDADGDAIVNWDDGRVRLPGRVGAGESADVYLPLHPPATAGRYRMQIDVVQEGAHWFEECGSEPLDCPIEVVVGATADYEGANFGDLLSAPGGEAPMFEMHGTPIAEVTSLLAGQGATLLGADEWVTEWHSFAYFVQAAP
jgi:SAM-dependent methyltransferase